MKWIVLVLVGMTCVSMFALLNSVSAKPLEGDVTRDGEVNIYDVLLIANHFGETRHSPDWKTAKAFDINKNGRIDIWDFILATRNYGEGN